MPNNLLLITKSWSSHIDNCINLTKLAEMIGDDKDFIREILSDFQQELEVLTEKIVNGFENQDIECLQQHIHNLRGISGSVCATALHEVLNDIDAAVKCKNLAHANSYLDTFLSTKNAASEFLCKFLGD